MLKKLRLWDVDCANAATTWTDPLVSEFRESLEASFIAICNQVVPKIFRNLLNRTPKLISSRRKNGPTYIAVGVYDGQVQLRRCCWTAAVLVLGATGQSADAVHSIQDRALRSPAYSWLRELTDSIGPRLTGSGGARRAAGWAVTLMKNIGLENVHIEPWQQRSGWERGRAEAELTRPARLSLNVASYGWTGSTPDAGVEADVVEVHRERIGDELRNAASWTGKVVFVTSRGQKPADGSQFTRNSSV
jgi:hypothetical protein